MKRWKRWSSMLLAVALCMSRLPMGALADGGVTPSKL
jgi:hypothetical protein